MIEVLFFGKMADVVGQRSLTIAVPADASLHALRDVMFASAVTEGRVAARDIRMSLNKAVTTDNPQVKDGDEVAFFSVFSGG